MKIMYKFFEQISRILIIVAFLFVEDSIVPIHFLILAELYSIQVKLCEFKEGKEAK